jgi:hypothetical protein
LTSSPVSVQSGEYDALVVSGGVYAADVEAGILAPVAELTGVSADAGGPSNDLVTDDGTLWFVDTAGPRLVSMTQDGRVTGYSLSSDVSWHFGTGVDFAVTDDGRPLLLRLQGRTDSLVPPLTAQIVTVDDSGALDSRDVGVVAHYDLPSVAALPNGGVLVDLGRALLRTTDATWQAFEEAALPAGLSAQALRRYDLAASGGEVCLTPSKSIGRQSGLEIYCTTDGESWESVDLTP